jgi:hypothetical protein
MMDKEKKIKLEELPDLGSEPEVKLPPTAKKKKPEPRIAKLKNMNDSEKSDALSLRWHFDRPDKRWGWLITLLILLFLQKNGHMMHYQQKRAEAAKQTYGMSEVIVGALDFSSLMRYPLILAIFIPVFFKTKIKSDTYFDLTFQGIETVKKVTPASQESHLRVLIKWEDIIHVEKTRLNNRDVLILSDVSGPVAEMIWDIDKIKKKVIKQVLAGLVSNKNAFRIFIEKDVT